MTRLVTQTVPLDRNKFPTIQQVIKWLTLQI